MLILENCFAFRMQSPLTTTIRYRIFLFVVWVNLYQRIRPIAFQVATLLLNLVSNVIGFNLSKTTTEGFIAFNELVTKLKNIHGPPVLTGLYYLKLAWRTGFLKELYEILNLSVTTELNKDAFCVLIHASRPFYKIPPVLLNFFSLTNIHYLILCPSRQEVNLNNCGVQNKFSD